MHPRTHTHAHIHTCTQELLFLTAITVIGALKESWFYYNSKLLKCVVKEYIYPLPRIRNMDSFKQCSDILPQDTSGYHSD